MSGVTKHIFDRDIIEINKEWAKQIKSVFQTLPREYTKRDLLDAIKKFYPFEWEGVCNTYDYYQTKDRFLINFKGKSRYRMPHPDLLILKNQTFIWAMSKNTRESYSDSFIEEARSDYEKALFEKRSPKIEKIKGKIALSKSKTQQVTPDFLDKMIGLYERKNTSQRDRMLILIELKKYFNKKVIMFFYKINDTEINRQLRQTAFYHLQSFNYNPRLRAQKHMQIHTNNKKQKDYLKNDYAFQTCNIPETPNELDFLLDNGRYQAIKQYDYFISHSSKDVEAVRRLIYKLNGDGKYVYCDWINDSDYLKRHLVCKATLSVIEKQLEKSKALLFVKSPNSLNSVWCKYELNYFHTLNRPIFFVSKESIGDNSFQIAHDAEEWYLDDDYKKLALFEGEKISFAP